jgi:hypothetical protein
MKMIKPLLAACLAAWAGLPATAVEVTMTFEEIRTVETQGRYAIDAFYNPITFTNALALVQSSQYGGPATVNGGSFMYQPSGYTVLTFAADSGVSSVFSMGMPAASGGFTSFSTRYATKDEVFVIPLNAQGNALDSTLDLQAPGALLAANLKSRASVLHLEDRGTSCTWPSLPNGTPAFLCGDPVGTVPETYSWGTAEMSFDGQAAYGLMFVGGYGAGAFDNLTIQTVVPEPSTYGLMFLGLLGIGIVRRQQTRWSENRG